MTRNYSWLLILVLSSIPFQASAKERGEALFNLCMSCHGSEGHGNQEISAPAIAGLPQWYIEAQIEKFQTGVRGKHPTDDAGNRMRPMARTLRGDDAKIVAAYVSKLAPAPLTSTVGGNAEKGKAYFAVCMACHGPTGDGNEALHAPPLKISNDWYLVHQLNNFKNKIRAADASKDTTGGMMAPMAATLPDEQAMKDVITYVQSLK
jgi:cytochrome c553